MEFSFWSAILLKTELVQWQLSQRPNITFISCCYSFVLYFPALTYFREMLHFYTPWKHRKICGFLIVSYKNKSIGLKWVNIRYEKIQNIVMFVGKQLDFGNWRWMSRNLKINLFSLKFLAGIFHKFLALNLLSHLQPQCSKFL